MWGKREATAAFTASLAGILLCGLLFGCCCCVLKTPLTSLFMHRYNLQVTRSFLCKTFYCSCRKSFWTSHSVVTLLIKSMHSLLTPENPCKIMQCTTACTVFPNGYCRFPVCSICLYIWFQTGLLCPWADWILHTFLHCAFPELGFNYVHGIRAPSSLHERHFELQWSNLGGVVESSFSVHLVSSCWKC